LRNMGSMFRSCTNLRRLDLRGWQSREFIKNVQYGSLGNNCPNLREVLVAF